MRFTVRASILKGMVSVMSSMTDQIKIVCEDRGISAVAVDPAHVVMVGFNIDKVHMDGYKGDGEEYGIDLPKLNGILKLADNDMDCTVELSDRLTVQVGNITRRMAVLDTASMTTPKIPNLSLDASVSMKASDLLYIMKAVQDIGDTVTIAIHNGAIKAVSEDDVQSSEYEWTAASSDGDAEATFPKDYVMTAVKSIPAQWDTTMEVSDDYPMKIVFGTETGGWFLIAPRVESEGE